MTTKLRSWWQKVGSGLYWLEQRIRQHRVAIEVVAIVLMVVIVLIIAGYWLDWTGFNGYNKVTIAHTISGTNAGTVTKTEEYQPGKALWDWLQLLIIPAVIAVSGYVINLTISRSEQQATEQRAQSERNAAEKRAETEREIALDNQREEALQEYIDKMSNFLLKDGLLKSDTLAEVRQIARAQTLTVIRRLDADRKGSLIRFLYEAELIGTFDQSPILFLEGADLSDANLNGVILSGINLIRVDLRRAKLNDAELTKTILGGSNLSEAELCRAKLINSDLGYYDINVSYELQKTKTLSENR